MLVAGNRNFNTNAEWLRISLECGRFDVAIESLDSYMAQGKLKVALILAPIKVKTHPSDSRMN